MNKKNKQIATTIFCVPNGPFSFCVGFRRRREMTYLAFDETEGDDPCDLTENHDSCTATKV